MASLTTPGVEFTLSSADLRLDTIVAIARDHQPVILSEDPDFRRTLRRGPDVLKQKLRDGEVIYGVNTGFGGNVRFVIPGDQLERHQRNLLEYHCCGVGEP